jgi:diacylglycerol kinase family enzyme
VGYLLLVSPASGSSDGVGLVDEARRRLHDVRTAELRPGLDLGSLIHEAARESRVVVAAGGDGTVNAAAQHMVGSGTLGVLPGGTLNHFARDLGLRDLREAFVALEQGRTRRVDAGRAGGRVFLNTAAMGIYPEVVRERERQEDRAGKWLAASAAAGRVLRRARPLVGRIAADGDERLLFAWMLFLGNNRFSTTPGSIGTRERLDEGVLDVRLLTVRHGRARRPRMALRILRSRQWEARRLVATEARRVDVRLDGGGRLVAWDGEVGEPTDRLEAEILPRALTVVVPGDGSV